MLFAKHEQLQSKILQKGSLVLGCGALAAGLEARGQRRLLCRHSTQLEVAARQEVPHLTFEDVIALRLPQLVLLQ